MTKHSADNAFGSSALRELVVIDWSDVTADQQWRLLRASVAVEGRSVTLY